MLREDDSRAPSGDVDMVHSNDLRSRSDAQDVDIDMHDSDTPIDCHNKITPRIHPLALAFEQCRRDLEQQPLLPLSARHSEQAYLRPR